MRTVVYMGAYMCRSILAASCLFLVGCSKPTVERTQFCQLPIIDEFASAHAENSCVFIKAESPHRIWVYVIGDLDDDQQLTDLLPIASDSAYLDARSVNAGIPKLLLEAINDGDIFRATDRYWLSNAESKADGKSISICAAESIESRRFYLRYGWSR